MVLKIINWINYRWVKNMKNKFDIDRKLSILIGLWILDKLIILAMFYWFER